MPVELEKLDKIPRIKRLSELKILSSDYSPNFKPTSDSCRATFNGMDLFMKVQGVEVTCSVSNSEGAFEITNTMIAPGSLTWTELWKHVVSQTTMTLYSTALDQKEKLVEAGNYYEQ